MAAGQRSTTRGEHRQIWRAATRYIDATLAAEISVAEVARAAFTSRRQLQRVFAAIGSTTVRAYVADARMRRAGALVIASNLPLAAIAAEVGYGHTSAFIKAFRRHHGCTPGELRRRLGGRIPAAVSNDEADAPVWPSNGFQRSPRGQ